MKKVLLILLLVAPSLAWAQSPVVGPPWRTTVHGNATITTGTVAQALTWTLLQPNGYAQANTIRCIQNPGAATEDLFVSMDNLNSTPSASATHGFDLSPGRGQCYFWAAQISVYAATTSHAILLTEIQW